MQAYHSLDYAALRARRHEKLLRVLLWLQLASALCRFARADRNPNSRRGAAASAAKIAHPMRSDEHVHSGCVDSVPGSLRARR